MPQLLIQGQKVQIGDDFLKLSPDEQNKAVEEIAKSFPGQSEARPAPAEAPGQKAEEGGFFERLWAGIGGRDVSRAGRIGMGMADPAYGGAQIGARLQATPGMGVPEQALAGPGPDVTKEVDAAVQQREQRYVEGRKKAGDKPGGFFDDIWRMLGNIGSPVTAPVGGAAGAGIKAAAGVGGRLAASALGGAAQATMQPVPEVKPGGSIAGAKAAQAGEGLIGGVLGGAAGEAVGSGLGKLIASGSGNEMDRAITRQFRTTMKPGIRGKVTGEALKSQDRQILSSTDDIIKRRQAQGKDPVVRQFDEYLDELGQTKKTVFDEYNSKMVEAAGENMPAPNPHLVDGFRRSGAATQQAANEVADAQNSLTLTRAAQSRAGDNVYMAGQANAGARVAEQRLAQATQKANRLQTQHQAITNQMYKPYVDLAPIASALTQKIDDVLAVHAPGTVGMARALVDRLSKKGFYTLSEAQDAIALLNQRLKFFYRNPQPHAASQAIFDAEAAGMLRRSLDKTIESLTGPGYQDLKLRYGALKAVEEDVVRAFNREANKVPGGIGGIFADLMATAHGLKAAFTFDPHQLAIALADKGAKYILMKRRDPNRAIAQMFARRVESALPRMGPARAALVGGLRSGPLDLPGAMGGTATATDALRQPPPRRRLNDVQPPASVR